MRSDNAGQRRAFIKVAKQSTIALEMVYIEATSICNFKRRSSERNVDRRLTSGKLCLLFGAEILHDAVEWNPIVDCYLKRYYFHRRLDIV